MRRLRKRLDAIAEEFVLVRAHLRRLVALAEAPQPPSHSTGTLAFLDRLATRLHGSAERIEGFESRQRLLREHGGRDGTPYAPPPSPEPEPPVAIPDRYFKSFVVRPNFAEGKVATWAVRAETLGGASYTIADLVPSEQHAHWLCEAAREKLHRQSAPAWFRPEPEPRAPRAEKLEKPEEPAA